MALGAVLAAALTNHAAHPNVLTVAGVDYIGAVSIDGIRVKEAGPGDVSTMSFSIEDTAGAVTISQGDQVLFWDVTNDRPRFAGFVTKTGVRAMAPGGRYIDVQCSGPEIVLDWIKVAATTIQAFSAWDNTGPVIQLLIGNAINGTVVPLRAFLDPGGALGTQAQPLSSASWSLGGTGAGAGDLAIPAGTTLREAIRMYTDASYPISPAGWTDFVTVDFYWGVRFWRQTSGGSQIPVDYTNLTVTDTPGSASAAANLTYATDGGGSPVAVYVQGNGFAALVTDGTNRSGNTAYLSDTGLDTQAKVQNAGAAYLAQYGAGIRGTFDLDYSSTLATTATVHPGSMLTLTDAATGASGSFRMSTIERTYAAGGTLEAWTISYGGRAPSLVSAMRRLTRAVLD